ncbi:MAG: hypothetical protein QOF57_135, partial [Frankiaceae bacterium]|nr:hypothetical protein [Frankiaceae bacterium]
ASLDAVVRLSDNIAVSADVTTSARASS